RAAKSRALPGGVSVGAASATRAGAAPRRGDHQYGVTDRRTAGQCGRGVAGRGQWPGHNAAGSRVDVGADLSIGAKNPGRSAEPHGRRRTQVGPVATVEKEETWRKPSRVLGFWI